MALDRPSSPVDSVRLAVAGVRVEQIHDPIPWIEKHLQIVKQITEAGLFKYSN